MNLYFRNMGQKMMKMKYLLLPLWKKVAINKKIGGKDHD